MTVALPRHVVYAKTLAFTYRKVYTCNQTN